MTAFKAVYGIATEDRHYGYIAVQPPLSEQHLAGYINVVKSVELPGRYALRANLEDDVTELEIWSQCELTSKTMVEQLAAKLGKVLRLQDSALTLLPGEVSVAGSAPLFDQYAEQFQELNATQSH
jgi:hypothetical protein